MENKRFLSILGFFFVFLVVLSLKLLPNWMDEVLKMDVKYWQDIYIFFTNVEEIFF